MLSWLLLSGATAASPFHSALDQLSLHQFRELVLRIEARRVERPVGPKRERRRNTYRPRRLSKVAAIREQGTVVQRHAQKHTPTRRTC